METFTRPRDLVDNPLYPGQRRKALAGLDYTEIDAPIRGLIRDLNEAVCCFTLQCCFGHFLFRGHRDPNNLDPLPPGGTAARIDYRIAYLAFFVENSPPGRRLLRAMKEIPAADPKNIQFGSADWFWGRQVNSYALQVEPERFKRRDRILVDYAEALRLERARDVFFQRVRDTLDGLRGNRGPA